MKLLITLLCWLYGPQLGPPANVDVTQRPNAAVQADLRDAEVKRKNLKARGNHTIIVIDDTHFFPPTER